MCDSSIWILELETQNVSNLAEKLSLLGEPRNLNVVTEEPRKIHQLKSGFF